MTPDDPRHGTTRGYHAGCHDACCRRAMARYEKAGRLARLNGGRAVSALGAQRRLQALMRLGWSSQRIAIEAGLPHRNHVWRILNGQKGKPTVWVQRQTDEWIRDVYERLSMTVPTGRYVDRTRDHAERQGWAPPLAWNNIDDPAEKPRGIGVARPHKHEVDTIAVERAMAGDRIRLTRAERFAVIARLRADGWTLRQIEDHTGITKPERYVEAQQEAS